MAMKPIDGTFAANAEKWGVSGIWVDGGRVETDGRPKRVLDAKETNNNTYAGRMNGSLAGGSKAIGETTQGRWPANVIHDGSDEVMAEFDKAGVRNAPWGKDKSQTSSDKSSSYVIGKIRYVDNGLYQDSGSAARYFTQCPPDPPQPNPCLDCTDCIIETEAPKGRWPAVEYIVMAMKPIDGTFAANAEKWGVSGIWVDGGRIEGEKANGSGQPPLKFNGQNHRPFHDNAKPRKFDTTKGRFPANVIHDGSDEVMAEFDKAGVRTSGAIDKNNIVPKQSSTFLAQERSIDYQVPMSKGSAARYFAQCPPDPTAHPEAARFKYCPKASKRERGAGNTHPTVKPLSLLRYLAKLTRPPDGGIVLDPFAGSGTTALACISEAREFILIEKEPEYAELCRRRIAEYSGAEVAPVEHKVTETETVKQMSLW
jgi:hypothetical protein